jgi:hypothetical protein
VTDYQATSANLLQLISTIWVPPPTNKISSLLPSLKKTLLARIQSRTNGAHSDDNGAHNDSELQSPLLDSDENIQLKF